MRRIEEFNRHFLDMKNKVEEIEKEVALSEIKVEEMVQRVKDVE